MAGVSEWFGSMKHISSTDVPQVNGFAAHYERTGDVKSMVAVKTFFEALSTHHSYATGAIQVPVTINMYVDELTQLISMSLTVIVANPKTARTTT